jgi:glycogen debranching enzyme
MRYRVELEPRSRWEMTTDVVADPGEATSVVSPGRFGEELGRVQESLTAWQLQVPQLRASWDALDRSFARSVSDLASLRMRGGKHGIARLPAAGMPWFMTVFGRDTLITSYQTLMFGPARQGALEVLAELQATEDDASIDAEPGRSSTRSAMERLPGGFARYYGTVDATPLYRCCLGGLALDGGQRVAQQLREPALRALGWIDEFGDRDGDGFVEYERRTERAGEPVGRIRDSQRFADGRIATAPIAPCEIRVRLRREAAVAELAREAWGDGGLAARLEVEAAELRERFDEAYWVDERAATTPSRSTPTSGASTRCAPTSAPALERDRPGRACRAGRERADERGALVGVGSHDVQGRPRLQPALYHNGTVWPHDNSLIAAGLARCGKRDQALRIVRRMLEAAAYFDYELPEVFAGLPRTTTPFPIAYPTAARPQAWAAGTPVLLLQVLLGLEPDRASRSLLTTLTDELPPWAGPLRLTGVRAFDGSWDVSVGDDGSIRVEPS